jgi:hypothetical protein
VSDDGPGHHDDSRAGTLKFAIVLAIALVMSALIALHVRGVNGPWYWFWTWRRLSPFPLYAAMLLAAAPVLLAAACCVIALRLYPIPLRAAQRAQRRHQRRRHRHVHLLLR